VIDADGITYLGGGPLRLSEKALQSFLLETKKLAYALKDKGAIGSFGPDFLITSNNETRIGHDTAVLIELNARVPYTAFPLEIIKQVKGTIGEGFYSRHCKVPFGISFMSILRELEKDNLLIKKKHKNATGVIPYNPGMLPFGLIDVVAMAENWSETEKIMDKTINILKKLEK
jgi:hypothetical protein